MGATDLLLTLAEISIAFVGFSAVIVIFRQFAGGEFSEFEHLQVAVMIQGGLLSLFFSIVPPLFELLPIPPVHAWRFASAVQALVSAAWLISFLRKRRRAVEISPALDASRVGYFLRMGGASAIIFALLLNSLITPESLVKPIYCFGVVWFLGVLGWLFAAAWRIWGRTASREE